MVESRLFQATAGGKVATSDHRPHSPGPALVDEAFLLSAAMQLIQDAKAGASGPLDAALLEVRDVCGPYTCPMSMLATWMMMGSCH